MAMTSPLKIARAFDPFVGGYDHPIALMLDTGIHSIGINPESLAFDAFFDRPNQFALVRRKIIGDNGRPPGLRRIYSLKLLTALPVPPPCSTRLSHCVSMSRFVGRFFWLRSSSLHGGRHICFHSFEYFPIALFGDFISFINLGFGLLVLGYNCSFSFRWLFRSRFNWVSSSVLLTILLPCSLLKSAYIVSYIAVV